MFTYIVSAHQIDLPEAPKSNTFAVLATEDGCVVGGIMDFSADREQAEEFAAQRNTKRSAPGDLYELAQQYFSQSML